MRNTGRSLVQPVSEITPKRTAEAVRTDMSITSHHSHSILLTISFLWCGLILSFPILLHSAQPLLASGIYLVFTKICHQDPSRSFWLGGIPLPACMRCTAVYFSFLGAVSVWPLLRRTKARDSHLKWLLLAAVVLMTVDAGLDFTGIRSSTLASRTLTGSLLGLAGGWITSSIAARTCFSFNTSANHG